MLEEDHRSRGVVRDVLDDAPALVLREDAFGGASAPSFGAHLSTLLAACPQADERPDHGAELGGLLAAQVAPLEHVHLASASL